MPNSSSLAIPFAGRSTADDVLSGVDLAGKTILITGCNSGIGFETMRALQAHGAHVIALARSEQLARDAIARAGGSGTPVACDLGDLASVDAAIGKIHGLGRQLDAVIANAGVMGASQAEQLYGVEKQFWVNHDAHFRLVNGLLDLVPDRTGRIVVVSSLASKLSAPKEGIAFGDLDGRKNYRATRFYAQSKLANALFARELSQRWPSAASPLIHCIRAAFSAPASCATSPRRSVCCSALRARSARRCRRAPRRKRCSPRARSSPVSPDSIGAIASRPRAARISNMRNCASGSGR